MLSFLLKRPSSSEWDSYVKNTVIFAITLSTVVHFTLSEMFYDYIYPLFFSQMAIASIGIWLGYQLRKSIAGKVFAVLALTYFLYNHSNTFIDVINGLNAGMFFLSILILFNTLLVAYALVRLCVLLFNDYGQGVDKDIFPSSNNNVSKYESISKLKELYDSGALSEEEFEAEKRKLLEQ